MKEGYKLTEVGIVPDDWQVEKLKNYATFKTGPFGSALHKSDYVEGGVPVINPMQINAGRIVATQSMAINEQMAQKLADFRLAAGNIIIGRRGEMGRCAVVTENEEGWLCGTGSMIIYTSTTADARFIQRFLSSPVAINAIESSSVGTTMINLNQQALANLLIPVPATPTEQTAIATALNDVDALISGLEKLIEKKRAIKQGAMQQLLKPKEGWKKTTLGEVCKIFGRIGFRGYTVKDIVPENEGALSISPSNILGGEMAFDKTTFISWEKYDESPEIKISVGDILLVKTASIGKTALVKYLPCPATLNPQLVVLKKISVNNVFLGYIMQHDAIQNQIKEQVVGGVVPTLSQEQIANFVLCLPKPDEQEKIANTLAAIDAEIDCLQISLDKYKQLKQGMIQELLTGKTRLI